MSNKIKRLYEDFGQSLWYDNISRDLLNNGQIQALVDDGIRGLTSNPSIFQKAMTAGTAYDEQMSHLVQAGKSPESIYQALAIWDIQRAADILRPVYDASDGADGFVSLEVSPLLARETEATIREVAHLWDAVDRPNLLVKIPATPEGLPAIEESLTSGYNVNITLLFSRVMYGKVIDAYLSALDRRAKAGHDVSNVHSVASFFVSRVDVLVDNLLDEKISAADDTQTKDQLRALKGRAGIANARLAYQLFKDKFEQEIFTSLKDNGAHLQRALWASTSTKNPDYSDVMYVDNLIGPHTVNTAPPQTIEAFRDHGKLARTIEDNLDAAQQLMEDLEAVGIRMTDVTDQLLDEGVEKFDKPYRSLLSAIEEKAGRLQAAM